MIIEPKPAADSSIGHWLYLAIIIPVAIGLIWSTFLSEFVPSRDADFFALGASMVVGALAGLYAWKSPTYRPGSARWAAMVAKAPGIVDPRVRIPILIAMSLVCTFSATHRGFLEWWTWAAGTEASRIYHVSSSRFSSRGGCEGFNVRESPFVSGPTVCGRIGRYPGPTPGAVVILSGKVTRFGMAVRNFDIQAPPTSSP